MTIIGAQKMNMLLPSSKILKKALKMVLLTIIIINKPPKIMKVSSAKTSSLWIVVVVVSSLNKNQFPLHSTKVTSNKMASNIIKMLEAVSNHRLNLRLKPRPFHSQMNSSNRK